MLPKNRKERKRGQNKMGGVSKTERKREEATVFCNDMATATKQYEISGMCGM